MMTTFARRLPILLAVLSASGGAVEAQTSLWTIPLPVASQTDPVLAELEDALNDYYKGWEGRILLHGAAPNPCDADDGDRCHSEDLQGGCSLEARRCRSAEESRRFVNRLVELALDHPAHPVATAHAIYAGVKLRHYDSVRRVVAACESNGLWVCDLLAGYAHHRMGSPERAAPAFQSALGAMDPARRCLYSDVEILLSEPARNTYAALPCDARGAVHEWFWWASSPFLAASAVNDRWTEHLTRITEIVMTEDFRSRRNWTSKGPEVREYPTRYVRRGNYDSWDRRWPRPDPGLQMSWTSRSAAFNHFVPDVLALDSLHPELEYRLIARLERTLHGSDEGYTRSGGRVVEVPVQRTRFLEGDSMVVALASRLADSRIGGTGQAYFMASTGPGDVVTLEPASLRETVVFAGQVANRRQVVGIEVLTLGDDARSRDVIEAIAADGPVISDVLLYRPVGFELPETRLRAAGMMHGSREVSNERSLGLYWEGYDLPADTELRASLRLVPVGGGFFGGLARALGFGGADETGAVSWTVKTPVDGIFTHAITLDLQTVAPGDYDLVLTMEAPSGDALTRTRTITVVGRGG